MVQRCCIYYHTNESRLHVALPQIRGYSSSEILAIFLRGPSMFVTSLRGFLDLGRRGMFSPGIWFLCSLGQASALLIMFRAHSKVAWATSQAFCCSVHMFCDMSDMFFCEYMSRCAHGSGKTRRGNRMDQSSGLCSCRPGGHNGPSRR